jgi:hypothetical protein
LETSRRCQLLSSLVARMPRFCVVDLHAPLRIAMPHFEIWATK